MKWNNLFKSLKGTLDSGSPEPASESLEIAISSEKPYTVVVDSNEDGFPETRTFTEHLEMKTDNMSGSIRIPAKVIYDDGNLLQLILYIPDAETNRRIREMDSDRFVNLWIFLENGDFLVTIPEFINPYIDEEGLVTAFQLNLGNTGFHSEFKNLGEKYPHAEICRLVSSELISGDIAEICPKILSADEETIECPQITVSAGSAAILKKAFQEVRS